MLILMVVVGFVFMLLYIKKENDNTVPFLIGTCVFALGIILLFFASVIGASAWVASAGIEELEEENKIIYELIETRLTSTDDEYSNETEQLFWNSQVERYISNQQLIAEKKRGSILVGNDTVFDILLLSDEMYLSNYMKISCWVLCLISIDPKEIRDAMSINK